MNKLIIALVTILALSVPSLASEPYGNSSNGSFSKAKRILDKEIYHDHRVTIYCEAEYDAKGNVRPPEGFETRVYHARAKKIEWEHVVAAENFGRNFVEWEEGHPQCVDSKGKAFKGRTCAEKINAEYQFMQADMYNLYPAIGAVNALRLNYNFTLLPDAESDFGSCEMKVKNKLAEPPANARGAIARTHKYMAQTYPRYSMEHDQRQLMDEWDEMYPVDAWECDRARRIEAVQGNPNPVVKVYCEEAGM